MTRAELHENLIVALDTLRSHKGRSALTILGVVIGVTSVIAVAAIITGLNRFVQARIESLGSRTFFISRVSPTFTFEGMSEKIRKRKYLDYSDGAYLRETCPDLEIATVIATRFFVLGHNNDITYGGQRVERVFVRGGEPEYIQALPVFSLARGRFVSRYDQEHARSVVVLGAGIADSLFSRVDPLGKTLRINGYLYEVIGVFERDTGFISNLSVDQFAIIPLSDFHKRYPEIRELAIAFTVARDASIERVKDQVVDAMRRRRHVPLNAENDFEIFSPDFFSALWSQATGAIAVLTGVVSSIGLLVGGIGVMNIMLISVTERTTEIGVRKAIGARRADIRAQFLLEAVVLTMTGGALGILLGAGVAWVVRWLLPSVPAEVSLLWVTLGVALSAGVGLFFGYYPANRAAQLDPIVCLHYE